MKYSIKKEFKGLLSHLLNVVSAIPINKLVSLTRIGSTDSLGDLINSEPALNKLVDGIDLHAPPGLAGEICRDLSLFEQRAIACIRPLVALMAMSFAGRSVMSFGGGNLRIFALAVAESAAGKEGHQTYLKMLFREMLLEPRIQTKPRSDKNIVEDIVMTEETLYLIDEVHSILRQGLNKGAAAFESGMISLLLELATSENFIIPSKIRFNIANTIMTEISRLENGPESDRKATELPRLKRIQNRLEEGWGEPFVSFLGYTTPINSHFIFTETNIDQGLLARFIILVAPEKREQFSFRSITHPSGQIIEKLIEIQNSNTVITMTRGASSALQQVTDILERDEYLNHKTLGALYARGRQAIVRVASVLAIDTRVIDEVHIKYGIALFLQNIASSKNELNRKTDKIKDNMRGDAERILTNALEKGGPMKQSLLAVKLTNSSMLIREAKKTKPNLCYELIDEFVKNGIILVKDNLVMLNLK